MSPIPNMTKSTDILIGNNCFVDLVPFAYAGLFGVFLLIAGLLIYREINSDAKKNK